MYTHIPIGVKTAQTLQGIEAQILQNKKDFPAAVQANINAGAAGLNEGAEAISGALIFLPHTRRHIFYWANTNIFDSASHRYSRPQRKGYPGSCCWQRQRKPG
jgi:hypothetical protein